MALSRAAVGALPEDVPAFLRKQVDGIAHAAAEPDVMRHAAMPQLKAAEAPEHYIDLELLEGAPLPAARYAYLKLCHDKGLDPQQVGVLPYAIVEAAQRLTIAFAEHRAAPDDADVQQRCVIYAGLLAHYAQDLCMPLHTTLHHDGRANPDGSSPRTGIHRRVDALPQKLETIEPEPVAAAMPDETALSDLVLAELQASHALVGRVYDLEASIPPLADGDLPPEVAAFARDRSVAAARFTAQLWHKAWHDSAQVKLPSWWLELAPPR